MQKQTRALGVAEELVTEPFAFGRARDEPGQVGDHERVVLVGAHDTEGRLERREGIVGDLRLGRRQARHEGRLARVGKAGHADVGEELQLEMEPALPAGPRSARRAAGLADGPNRALPRPPRAPRIASTRWPGTVRSPSDSPVSRSATTVPSGTFRTRSAPLAPWRFQPRPRVPRPAW